MTLSDAGEPEEVRVALVTPSVLSLLGAKPVHGRLFSAGDMRAGAPGVVLLGYGIWVRRYGADPGIVGKPIELNRVRHRVIGILTADVQLPSSDTQIWFPLILNTAQPDATTWYLRVIGRLRASVRPAVAAAELGALLASLRSRHPDDPLLSERAHLRVEAIGLRDAVVEAIRTPLSLLLGSAALGLVVVWANTCTLFVIRGEERRYEIALKRSLGAAPFRVIGELYTEIGLMATAAALVAGILTYFALEWRFGLSPHDVPRLDRVHLNGTVLTAIGSVALLSSLFFGAALLWRSHSAHLATGLRLGRTRRSTTMIAAQRGLIALQFAFIIVLLVGAAAMAHSFYRLQRVDLGFDPTNVTIARISLPYYAYPRYTKAMSFFSSLELNLVSSSDVVMAGSVSTAPLERVPSGLPAVIAGEARQGDTGHRQAKAILALATPTYFKTMRVPIVDGRNFEPGDAEREDKPVLINLRVARRLFGESSAVGTGVRVTFGSVPLRCRVVGVIGDVPGERSTQGYADILYFPAVGTARPDAWMPLVPVDMTVVVRSRLPADVAVARLRQAVRDLDPKLAITNLSSMESLVSADRAQLRLMALLVGCAAFSALALGLVGVYGVVRYSVQSRLHGIGVRLAIGAKPEDVVRLLVREIAWATGVGALVGGGATLFLGRLLRAVTFETNPQNPLVISLFVVVLAAIALAAAYLTARRAGHLNLLEILNSE